MNFHKVYLVLFIGFHLGLWSTQALGSLCSGRSLLKMAEETPAEKLTQLLNSRVVTLVDGSTLNDMKRELQFVLDAGADVIQFSYESRKLLADALEAVEDYKAINQKRKVFLAGSLDLSDDFSDHEFDFDQAVLKYKDQIKTLIGFGVDVLHFKSVQYTQLAKAAIYALNEVKEEEECGEIGLFISCIVNENGRMKCGQTPSAFAITVQYAKPLSVGVECSNISMGENLLGDMAEYVGTYSSLSVGVEEGKIPPELAMLKRVNMVMISGSSDMKIIGSVVSEVNKIKPVKSDAKKELIVMAGTEPLRVYDGDGVDFRNLLKIGQRCDVPNIREFRETILQIAKLNDEICEELKTIEPTDTKGPFKYAFRGIEYLVGVMRGQIDINGEMFLKLMNKTLEIKKLQDKVLQIARDQVALGAQVINILFDPIRHSKPDEWLPDTKMWMKWFVQLFESDTKREPENEINTHVAGTPLCIDSSSTEVILEGLKYSVGSAIANAVSLANGEEKFKANAKELKKLGPAAIIAIALRPEDGLPARGVEEKVDLCVKMYNILVNEVGYDPHEVILDPLVTRTAQKHLQPEDYGWTFLEATKQIRRKLGNVRILGGVTAISQVFRQQPGLRPTMNKVFLEQCMMSGMYNVIMGVENVADETEKILLEDLVTNRDPEAKKKLKEFYRARYDD